MVVDTCIFIEFLRTKDKKATTLYSLSEENLCITSVTVYELLLGATSVSKKKDVVKIIEDLPVLSFTKNSAIIAGDIFHDLKRRNKLIEFRDIFIASICISNELPLKTLNNKHFNRIDGLNLI